MRTCRQGLTLVEMLLTAMLSAMIVGVVTGMTIQTSRYGKKVRTTLEKGSANRFSMDVLSNDIKESDEVVAGIPLIFPIFRSNTTDTLILKVPEYDASNNKLPSNYTVVIYNYSAGRKELKRAVLSVANNIVPVAFTLETVMKNVDQVSFDYSTMQSFNGDGGTNTFNLSARPVDATKARIMIGPTNWNNTAWASITNQTVNFTRPPQWGKPIDIFFGVNPGTVTTATGGCGANLVKFTMRSAAYLQNAKNQLTPQYTTYSSQLRLLGQ